jgi:predicted RNA binding protein YcfA (HicA-like mRNA interferase family)
MGRLAGFKYREVVQRLQSFGYTFDRHGPGSHEIWRNAHTGARLTLPNHIGDIAEGTLRTILRQAGISVDDFLDAA